MTKDQAQILHLTQKFIHQQFTGEGTGHDYFHVERVVNLAKTIAQKENADLFLVELAAWLHDLGDYKLNGGIDQSQIQISHFLNSLKVDLNTIDKVVEIVSQVSFSKGKIAESLEAKIVQDADRLDAIGAVGIARVFAYGGSKSREIWNQENPKDTSIQHFYDKLLKLKDLMNTDSAKEIAQKRHHFLEVFLQEFYQDWSGN